MVCQQLQSLLSAVFQAGGRADSIVPAVGHQLRISVLRWHVALIFGTW